MDLQVGVLLCPAASFFLRSLQQRSKAFASRPLGKIGAIGHALGKLGTAEFREDLPIHFFTRFDVLNHRRTVPARALSSPAVKTPAAEHPLPVRLRFGPTQQIFLFNEEPFAELVVAAFNAHVCKALVGVEA